jgi:hypothetical protein
MINSPASTTDKNKSNTTGLFMHRNYNKTQTINTNSYIQSMTSPAISYISDRVAPIQIIEPININSTDKTHQHKIKFVIFYIILF